MCVCVCVCVCVSCSASASSASMPHRQKQTRGGLRAACSTWANKTSMPEPARRAEWQELRTADATPPSTQRKHKPTSHRLLLPPGLQKNPSSITVAALHELPSFRAHPATQSPRGSFNLFKSWYLEAEDRAFKWFLCFQSFAPAQSD